MDKAMQVAALRRRIAALERELRAEEEADETKTASRRLMAQIDTILSQLENEGDTEKVASLSDPDGVEERISQKRLSEVARITHGSEFTTDSSMLDTRTDDGEVDPDERSADNEPDVERPATASRKFADDDEDDTELDASTAADEDEDEDEEEVAVASRRAHLRDAVRRLDRVADYLESRGYRRLAFRVDRVSDAIEARLKSW